MTGRADEVKSLLQLAGGIIMGGLALYKLSNVEENEYTEGKVMYVDKRHENRSEINAPSAQSRQSKVAHMGQNKQSKESAYTSWRSEKEVAAVGDPRLGNWRASGSERDIDDEFEKEIKETSSGPSTGISSVSEEESDSDDEVIPSWMSKKDPQVHARADVVPQYTPTKLKLKRFNEGRMMTSNEAISDISYALSDTIFVYPLANLKGNHLGKRCLENAEGLHETNLNLEGYNVDVKVMETRAGAGAAVLGALQGGSKTTVLASSETLRTMIPNLFEIAEKRLPAVFHVAAAKIDSNSLEFFADFTDVMRIRETGVAMLASGSNQEASDMAVVSHLAAQEHSLPVVHFFDAVRGLNVFSNVQSANLEVAKAFNHGNDRSPVSRYGLEVAAPDNSPYFATALQETMNKLKTAFSGREYKIFEYTGPSYPDAVVVAFGATATTMRDCILENLDNGVGLINVRLIRPWSSYHFLQALPRSTRKVCILDQSGELSPLFHDIAGTMHSDAADHLQSHPTIVGGRVQVGGLGFDKNMAYAVMTNIIGSSTQSSFVITENNHGIHYSKEEDLTELLIFSESSESVAATKSLINELGNSSVFNCQQMATQDPYSFLYRSELRLADKDVHIPEGHVVKLADVIVTNEENFETAILSAREGGKILVSGIIHSLSEEFKPLIVQKKLKLFGLEGLDGRDEGSVEWLYVIAAIYLGRRQNYDAISPYLRNALFMADKADLVVELDNIERMLYRHGYNVFQPSIKEMDSSFESNSIVSQGAKSWSSIPKYSPRFDVCDVDEEKQQAEIEDPEIVAHHKVAWKLMFKESFDTKHALRPAHHDVHFASVTKFERLTPEDYSRNIFHLEFDISNTSIKYEIGDALGVFGHNDEAEVENFIKHYGLDPDSFVRLPKRGAMTKNKGEETEIVSVRNLLVQHLDLFGRPSKKFYTSLAQFAKSRYEYLRLMHIGTDDTESFKIGIHETMTHADILLQYKTARPTVEELAKLIPEIKPRHYSISSSMKVCPRSVHLLVVAVDWETPLGRKRSGQCTRYLKNLKPGDTVSVDIQKSVLRLPPNPKQPIVMAGLGTGMAPFRAFLQERLWQKESGIDVGPCVLYFGARHKKQEWLYGVELEKYQKMGLVRLGLAWSRDQKHKVYIQHKIKEDGELLKEYLGEKKGYFYLCGPTWPVPDVRDAIAGGLTPEKVSKDGEIDVQVVEELKEEGRYILEVY